MIPARRRQMVDREHPKLPIVRQCALLGVTRSNIYYRPKMTSEEDLSLMGEIDRQYLETPFYGSRWIVNADELLTRFRRWGLDPPWTCCLDRGFRVDPPPAWFPCRRTRIDPPGYWPAILSVLKWPATSSVRVVVVGIVLGSSQQVMRTEEPGLAFSPGAG